MHEDALYLAVDLGAGSGRVMLGGVAPGELRLDEVRRFKYPVYRGDGDAMAAAGAERAAPPSSVALTNRRDGHLRWPFATIASEVHAGLRAGAARARELGRPIRSVGVDTWGVDYGLVDEAGRLLEDPVCYRDERNAPAMESVVARLGRSAIFARTGIQFLVFNTLFQLEAHAREGLPAQARRLMMIPDLLHFGLSGRAVVEYTNASTTQLLDVHAKTWDPALVEAVGFPRELLPEVVPAGTDLGVVRPDLARELGLEGVRVVAPATHDTGSAVAGAPLQDGWAYISSGTWSLVGVERSEPLVDERVARENFTNEGGAFGTIRFLKNVMGLWLLESCRREWQEAGRDAGYDALLAKVATLPSRAVVFPDDPRFLNPPSMTAALRQQLAETGQSVGDDPAELAKVVLDSLALRYASVVATIERLTGRSVAGIQVVGGGGQNAYLNQATADACSRPVLAGPVEATATGNLLVQAIAAGRFSSLAEARAHVAASVRPVRFDPRRPGGLDELAERYRSLEARFLA